MQPAFSFRDLAFLGRATFQYDAEVLDWVSRILGNGSTIAQASVDAADTFMKAIKSAGVRSKILRLNLFAGDNPGAALIPLIKDAGAVADGNPGPSNYSESRGFWVNNPSERITTAFNPSVSLTDDSAHMGIYLGGTPSAQAAIVMGVTQFGGNDFYLTASYTALGQVANIWSGTGRPVAADTDGTGFYMGSRTSGLSTGVKIYRNGSLTGTSSSVGGNAANATGEGVHVMNCNQNGTPLTATNKDCRGYQIGTGLSDSEAAAVYSAWLAFNTALSRA